MVLALVPAWRLVGVRSSSFPSYPEVSPKPRWGKIRIAAGVTADNGGHRAVKAGRSLRRFADYTAK